MDKQNKVVIDENIDNTFMSLNEKPSNFRFKDYASNLPKDYTNDFIFALYESALTYSAKITMTMLALRDFVDLSKGTKIESQDFNILYDAAKTVNPNCKNEYLPLLFSYVQMIGGEQGLTEEQNDILLSKIANRIANDVEGKFPEKLYKADEYLESVGKKPPAISKSFLNELEKFYNNIISNETSNNLFDKKVIDTILNQYLDDMYSLSNTDDGENEIVWYKRTNKIFEIERIAVEDKTQELLSKSEKESNIDEISKAILKGINELPIYEDGNYNFSNISTAMQLLANNCENLIDEYNKENKVDISIPQIPVDESIKNELNEACRFFISSYVTALLSQKQGKGKGNNDPYKLLDPNIKINLLKANEKIFTLVSSNKNFIEHDINLHVRILINISRCLASFLEKDKSLEENINKNISKEINVRVSSNDVIRYMLRYFNKQNLVFDIELRELEKVNNHKLNNKNYKADDIILNKYINKYAKDKSLSQITSQELIDIIDRKADKFFIALKALDKGGAINRLATLIKAYNVSDKPDIIKAKELKNMDDYITKVLKDNRCKDKETIDTFIQVFHEAITFVPAIKDEMSDNLVNKGFTNLKSTQIYKKATAFSNVVAPTLYLNKDKCKTTYRYVQHIITKSILNNNQKYIVKDYIVDDLVEILHLLENNTTLNESINKIASIIDNLDETNQNSYIKNGVMSVENKKIIVNTLKEIYKNLPNDVKTNKDMAQLHDLVDLIPNLIKKVPSDKDMAKNYFIDFICEYNKPIEEIVRKELNNDLKYVVKDGENDPYNLKTKYKEMIPETEHSTFETLWNNLPKTTAKTRDKNIFKECLEFIISNLDKDERTAYTNYFRRIFPTKKEEVVASTPEERKQIEAYKDIARKKLVELINSKKDDKYVAKYLNSMQKILDLYTNSKPAEETEDGHKSI